MLSWGDHHFDLTRLFFQRSLAFVYFVAFLAAFNQFRGLLGSHGLQPVSRFVGNVPFWESPSLFFWRYDDRFIVAVMTIGIFLAVLAFTGISERFGMTVSVVVWALMWFFYLSIVNVGQTFYSFGWESLLLETGFLAIFLGSRDVATPEVVIWLLRWILFRIMFGAGLIKLRGDPCWRDLTCLTYYYETQPMPNPVSWYVQHLPVWVHKTGVLFTHFTELIVPWFIFFPQPICAIAGIIMIGFQGMLIATGNLSWLNYLTIVLCISCFADAQLQLLIPAHLQTPGAMGFPRRVILGVLFGTIAILSVRPVKNLFSRHQAMNRSYDPFHIVGTYGAFGSVTAERNEVIIEGTNDDPEDPNAVWKEYEIPGKPGDIHKMPPIVAPYHLRLGWLLWFAAMNDYRYYSSWFVPLMEHLLLGTPEVLGLLKTNPFPDAPPKFIRAELYRYHFATPEERQQGLWWHREKIGQYFPVVSLQKP